MFARFLLLAFLIAGPAAAAAAPACPATKPMTFTVTRVFHRDLVGFTEGLEVRGHDIYESTGSLFGGSRLMRMAPDGHVTVLASFGDKFFGEGLTILHDQIYQLTWKEHLVFVYDLNGHLLRSMTNNDEGWGLTNDGSRLIFSDGSAKISFADPKNFAVTGSVTVRRGTDPVEQLNELEYVNGKVYANVFETRHILRIDPASGCVEADAVMDTLWDHMTEAQRNYTGIDGNFVLNGIAYDHATGLFTLTGKEWPMVFVGRFEDGK